MDFVEKVLPAVISTLVVIALIKAAAGAAPNVPLLPTIAAHI